MIATYERRNLHNEKLQSLYLSPNLVRAIKTRRLRWACQIAGKGEGGGAFKILMAKPTGKKPVQRSKGRWEDNICMDLTEIGILRGIWFIRLRIGIIGEWRALVNAGSNLRVP